MQPKGQKEDRIGSSDKPMKKSRLARNMIIQALVEALKPLGYVPAFWEGGAIAFNRIDQWSDIDLYVLVDDDKVDETFRTVEKALESLSPIGQKLELPQTPWPGVSQAFYKLKNASEYLVIDFAVLKLSGSERFLEPEIHGDAVFYFKSDNVMIPGLDRNEFDKKLHARLERLKVRLDLFNSAVQKEINRGNSLEAIDLYQNLTLGTLVEALRMKHNPVHYNFKMRYVHYELPSKVVRRLEQLYFVKNMNDLQEKYRVATKWASETIAEIDEKKPSLATGTK